MQRREKRSVFVILSNLIKVLCKLHDSAGALYFFTFFSINTWLR
jgi:hypothetical protein